MLPGFRPTVRTLALVKRAALSQLFHLGRAVTKDLCQDFVGVLAKRRRC